MTPEHKQRLIAKRNECIARRGQLVGHKKMNARRFRRWNRHDWQVIKINAKLAKNRTVSQLTGR